MTLHKNNDRIHCGVVNCDMITLFHGHYLLEGPPTPLMRPRISQKRLWDSQKENKLVTGITLDKEHILPRLFEGPLILIAEFLFKFPKKMSLKDRTKLRNKPYEKVPDLDNLLKYVADCAGGGVLYHNDCIITNIQATKRYADISKTVFTIAEEI